MARRSNTPSRHPAIYALAALIFIALPAAFFFSRNSAQPYRTTDSLDVAAYMENSGSLRGNVYRMEAEVMNSLAYSPTAGRLISVVPGENQILPVLIPSHLSHFNIQKGQRFVFLLEVDERGLLSARELTKS